LGYIRDHFSIKMKYFILISVLIHTVTSTVYLTTDDFEEKTTGKKGMVAFKAPWCGHCKKLKPDWDKLADNVDVLIGEVDCTVEKDLCSKHGVQGFPTIKYTNGYGWDKYESGRDLNSLEKFVTDTLTDGCFDDESLCTEEELQKINEVKQLTPEEIDSKLSDIGLQKKGAETLFQEKVQELQNEFKKLQEEKTTTVDKLSKEQGYLQYVSSLTKTEL